MPILIIKQREAMDKDTQAERAAVKVQIEVAEMTLDYLRGKLRSLGGSEFPTRTSTRYRRVQTIQAIRTILEESRVPMSIEELVPILIENGNEIADTTDPEGNTRRSVSKGVEHQHVQILKDGRVWLFDEPIPEESD